MFAPIISRCLSKRQDARYADPIQLLDALSRVCKDNGIALRPRRTIESQKAKELSDLAGGSNAANKNHAGLLDQLDQRAPIRADVRMDAVPKVG